MKLLMVINSKCKLSENQRFLFDFETKYQTLNFSNFSQIFKIMKILTSMNISNRYEVSEVISTYN